MKILFKTVRGLEEITSQEILEKLNVTNLVPSPYGFPGWIKCEVENHSFRNLKNLRSVIEAYVILLEEKISESFSIDQFADQVAKALPVYAPHAQRISVSAYSSHKKTNQREIQGAFAKRIVKELHAECNLKNYDISLRVTLLRKTAIAAINLEIRPGNIPKKLETHPTPLLPPIAYIMIKLTFPKEGEHLLDPMCGCGTIPCIAALEWKNLKITGSDISSKHIQCAKRNAEKLELANKINFIISDITELKEKVAAANIIVVNPPYGVTIPTQNELGKLYNAIFKLANNILQQGRIAIITPYPQLVKKTAEKNKLQITNIYEIHEGELTRTIQIIKN